MRVHFLLLLIPIGLIVLVIFPSPQEQPFPRTFVSDGPRRSIKAGETRSTSVPEFVPNELAVETPQSTSTLSDSRGSTRHGKKNGKRAKRISKDNEVQLPQQTLGDMEPRMEPAQLEAGTSLSADELFKLLMESDGPPQKQRAQGESAQQKLQVQANISEQVFQETHQSPPAPDPKLDVDNEEEKPSQLDDRNATTGNSLWEQIAAEDEDEQGAIIESAQSLQHHLQNSLPPPLYLATAIHTNLEVFPRIMTQIQPQVDKRWTVDFVIANRVKEKNQPLRNWSVIFDSEAYIALAAVVHSITFHEFNTTSKGFRIANDFMLRHDWWAQLPSSIEYIWLLQDDSAVCTSHSKYCIQDFLVWDYLGAPWPGYWWRPYWGRFGNEAPWSVPSYGNGGFSLRSRRLQVECTEPSYAKAHRNGDMPEDVFFSMCLRDKKMGFRVAPTEVAKLFFN